MPQGFGDDFEGEICDEELREYTPWNYMLSADPDGEEVLLLNIRDRRIFRVAHDLSFLICRDGIGKVSKTRFNVRSELILM